MAILELPTRTDLTAYDFEVDLEGATYTVELRWNKREMGWFISIADSAGLPLVSGRKVTLGVDLLGYSIAEGMPPGILYIVDTSGGLTDPGIADLGARVRLRYLEAG